jgi:hypothetical protein
MVSHRKEPSLFLFVSFEMRSYPDLSGTHDPCLSHLSADNTDLCHHAQLQVCFYPSLIIVQCGASRKICSHYENKLQCDAFPR